MVSVIIPNYNHACFLEQRINSVLNQTYNSFEVIILDDCSTDNSCEIFKKYSSHPKIKSIIFNEQNSGSTFKQWDKGIELATGEWIWIAESDDYCEPCLLETLINNANSSEDTVLSYCQSVQVDENNKFIRSMYFHTDPICTLHWRGDYHNIGNDEIFNYLIYRNTIPNASAVIFKREAYKSVSKSFTLMKLSGDWYLWVMLLLLGNISFVAKPLNYFRTHPATTRSGDTVQKTRFRLREEFTITSFLIKNSIGTEEVQNMRKREILESFANTLNKQDLLKFLFKADKNLSRIPNIEILKIKLKRMINRTGLTS